MSRNFLLHFGDRSLGQSRSISALVPFADLTNHSVDPTVVWSWDSGSGQFVMNILGDSVVPAGTELSIDYSPGHRCVLRCFYAVFILFLCSFCAVFYTVFWHSGQDPRHQRPPFYFGVFYGFLERAAKDRRVFLEVEDGPFDRRPLLNKL